MTTHTNTAAGIDLDKWIAEVVRLFGSAMKEMYWQGLEEHLRQMQETGQQILDRRAEQTATGTGDADERAPEVPLSDIVLLGKLRACISDPMSADHAEISKNTLRAAATAVKAKIDAHRAALAKQAAAPDDKDARLGRYIKEFAIRGGWNPDDSEGAFEFIQRHSYALGLADMGGKPSTEARADRWPVSAFTPVVDDAGAQAAVPIYQIQFYIETGSSTWHDASEDAYHTTMPERRRIVYATPATAQDDARDAARYRWLRNCPPGSEQAYVCLSCEGDEMDEAIDATLTAPDNKGTAGQDGAA